MSECIIWPYSKKPTGYGNKWVNGKCKAAHRIAYEEAFGKFDESLHVLHKCDNPSCVNPVHLFLGTHQDNMADKKRKGRCLGFSNPGERNGGAKIAARSVKLIRQFLFQGITGKEIAFHYGLSVAQISRIKNNKKWSSLK